ncbi:MAG: hypothetical protein M0P91_06885 [Sulfuricurvum sp.]|uniref:hypothetical protein n=1 Tax=Sulfuricurvum sp. TaxID=2025608 RepID=UPI0025F5EB61|nr:hypothetical protein [Sulfuricurvum sp.]MCK9372906.1 hypothetical protein [Sulfuricurvum sp.]
MSTPEHSSHFEEKLDETAKILQACQEQHSVTSCFDCSECIGCDTRAKYVRSVYESMSKGETGGFDF